MTSRHTSVVLAAARRLLDLAGSSVPIDVKRLAAVQGVASVRPVAMKEDARLVDFGRLEIEYRQFAAEAGAVFRSATNSVTHFSCLRQRRRD